MINFNEKRYVEENFLTPSGKLEDVKDLILFARYYHEQGMDMTEVQQLAIPKACKYSIAQDYVKDKYIFNHVVWQKVIKRKQYANEPVVISKCEYDWIRKIGYVEKEKVLFTLLVIQKFLGTKNVKITYKDLRNLSLTKRSNDALWTMVDELQAAGYVKRVKDKTYSVRSPKCKEDEPFITVTDYNHISAPYLKTLKTDQFYYCEWCGSKVKIENQTGVNKKVYCEKCAKVAHKERYRS